MKKVIFNRLVYVIIGAVIGSSLVYLGCGNSDGKMVISAKNIVFHSSRSNIISQNKINRDKVMSHGGLVPSAFAQEELQDESLKVFAEDVLLDTNDNSLESGNLQDALDNEMAIDIPSALSGKTWLVENRSAHPDLDNCSGQITFISLSEFTLDSGKVAFPGLWAKSADRTSIWMDGPGYAYTESVDVEFLSNNVMWVKWRILASYLEGGSADCAAVIQVIPVNRGKFIFAGYNPTTGHYGVSTLTLVE
jgi:hypothetical protein